MAQDRRLLLAGLTSVLALSACRSNTAETCEAPSENEDVQNAMTALVESVEALDRTTAQFGTANPRDIVPQVRAAAAAVKTAVDGLRQSLGFSDSN